VVADRPRFDGQQMRASWDRARLRVVVPVGMIVFVAIVCIVVAVMTSARQADEAALARDEQLFTRSLNEKGERILRELESVAHSEQALQNIRVQFDRGWVQNQVGRWLEAYFNHDFVFVADQSDHLIYSRLGRRSVEPKLFNSVLPALSPVLAYVRGRLESARPGTIPILTAERPLDLATSHHAVMLQHFVGRLAIIVGVAVVPPGVQEPDSEAPAVLSVKFIDDDVLGEIATRLQLSNLRQLGDGQDPAGDHVFRLADRNGHVLARFAWAPKRPGAEIVSSVFPFIAIAFAGFALLAALVLRYMRRTAETIEAGEAQLRQLAMHDPLCALPNRIYFSERLETVLDDVQRGGQPAALFYIDLDHFKDVNDTLGHPIGDELIRSVAKRLGNTTRGDDLVARLGGDEFAVITSVASDSATLQSIAARIITALCAPYLIADQTILIGASIGIAMIDRRARAAADIMRYADMALYRAKNEGRNRACIYDAAMDADLSHRKNLESELREAIENNNLHLVYQPLVNNSGETITGVEALARWNHPVHGDIPPAEFIPIAEHSGLIIPLGEWVLKRACLDAKAWPGLTVAVNVSPLQFRRTDFVEIVERILSETEFDASRLELEVTESTFLGNVETAEAAMLRLKALGVRLALDDFGTGYSSLLYLRRFPFDRLKIDRSFVRSIEKAADAAAIVHAVVSLGRGLGMKVTAEGVETAEQHLFLRAAGVHTMQGFRFGRPVPAQDVPMLLARPRASAAVAS
jgi:diguanylate cyclase (GGDEF)-like protein